MSFRVQLTHFQSSKAGTRPSNFKTTPSRSTSHYNFINYFDRHLIESSSRKKINTPIQTNLLIS